jgi:hypothetical protein
MRIVALPWHDREPARLSKRLLWSSCIAGNERYAKAHADLMSYGTDNDRLRQRFDHPESDAGCGFRTGEMQCKDCEFVRHAAELPGRYRAWRRGTFKKTLMVTMNV